MIDLHTHLWEHGPGPLRVERGRLEAYCDQAAARGVTTIAVTEHLERFRQARDLLGEPEITATPRRPDRPGRWPAIQARLADPQTWKDLVYQFLQFPLGIATFTIATSKSRR